MNSSEDSSEEVPKNEHFLRKSIIKNYPLGWPKEVKYVNVCRGEKYIADPLNFNENKIEIKKLNNNIINGYGVFALLPISNEEIICEYTGNLRLKSEKSKSSKFLLSCGNGLYIDAKKCGNSSRYINDYRNIAFQPNIKYYRLSDYRKYQYKSETFCYHIVIKAIRNIDKGEQLLVNYGEGYCKKWKIVKNT